MKKSLLIATACSVLALACHNTSKNPNPGGFTINGTIKGMDSGWIFFGHNDTIGFVKDSAQIKKGEFIYMGKVKDPTQYYMWKRDAKGIDVDPINFFVDDTLIRMNVNKDTLQQTVIMGSPAEDQYLQYKQALKPVKAKMDELNKAYTIAADKHDSAAIADLDKQYEQIEKEENDAAVDFIHKNPASVIGAWYVDNNLLYNIDVKLVGDIYSKFPPAVQQTHYGRTIKKILDISVHLQPGMMAPDFTQNDTAGKPVPLASYKGKYLLLDFWASWCGPCRRENPNVVAAYNKYKDKNFNILAVSLDDNKEAWLSAVAEDHLAWTQVSDLRGFQNAAATQYGIMAIPSNYLIDPEGKIVAHNLRGKDLEKKLAEVIK